MPTRTIEKRVDDLEIAMTSLSVLPARVTSLDTQIVHLRDEMRAGFSAMRGELGDVRGELKGLRDEFRTGPERMATWSETRVMYEDLIERIKLLGEGIRTAVTRSSSDGATPAPAPPTAGSRARRRPRKGP